VSGTGRTRQVGELLDAALASLVSAPGNDGRPVSVLDCGGGSGRFAVPLAQAGAVVTVVDVSVDALATLRRRAAESGVGDQVTALQGDVEALAEVVPGAVFDLVLAHGILEAVEVPNAAFAGIAAAVRADGLLSVLIDNPVAAVLSRALAGDLAGAERELAELDSGAVTSPDLVGRLCAEHGLVVERSHGIGVFRDLVPGSALDVPGARDALDRLDGAIAQRAPFDAIAGRVHLLARRTPG
jgi:SAM-dependent methyltransferase